jgi:hypothetical protein
MEIGMFNTNCIELIVWHNDPFRVFVCVQLTLYVQSGFCCSVDYTDNITKNIVCRGNAMRRRLDLHFYFPYLSCRITNRSDDRIRPITTLLNENV